jgi:hypothetical protein
MQYFSWSCCLDLLSQAQLSKDYIYMINYICIYRNLQNVNLALAGFLGTWVRFYSISASSSTRNRHEKTDPHAQKCLPRLTICGLQINSCCLESLVASFAHCSQLCSGLLAARLAASNLEAAEVAVATFSVRVLQHLGSLEISPLEKSNKNSVSAIVHSLDNSDIEQWALIKYCLFTTKSRKLWHIIKLLIYYTFYTKICNFKSPKNYVFEKC